MDGVTSTTGANASIRHPPAHLAKYLASLIALPDRDRLQSLTDALADALDVPIAGITIRYREHCWFPVARGVNASMLAPNRVQSSPAFASFGDDLATHAKQEAAQASADVIDRPGHICVRAAIPLIGVYHLPLGSVFVADHRPRRDFTVLALPRLHALVDQLTRDAAAPHQIHRYREMVIEGFEALILQNGQPGDDPMIGAIDRLLRTALPRTNIHHWSMNL